MKTRNKLSTKTIGTKPSHGRVAQSSNGRSAVQCKKPPAAPPVYRPQSVPLVLQAKMANPNSVADPAKTGVAAPAVYRPQSTPKVLQRKVPPPSANKQNAQSSRTVPVRPVVKPPGHAIQPARSPGPRVPSTTIQASGFLSNLFTSSGVTVHVMKDVVPNRDNSKLGIGEEIILSISNPSLHRPLNWNIHAGGGKLTAGPANGGATYQAPSTAANVVLQLLDETGGVHDTRAYQVIEPIPQLILDAVDGLKFKWGGTNGGFRGTARMLPNTVSFANLQISEGQDAAPWNDSGVFKGTTGPHAASGLWCQARAITQDGTLFSCTDTVALKSSALDRMDVSSARKHEVMGMITRFIQWHYKVKGDPTIYDWCVATSVYTAYGDGRLERSKGGAIVEVDIFGGFKSSRVKDYIVEGESI